MDQNVEKKVAVLMPVYNSEKYLNASIESILNQTYAYFNFYIINDGSTDASEKIILSYKDERIIYIKNEVNKGLIYTLNKGMGLIKSKYLVRMDADDISMPERLLKQVEFMDMNPEIYVCGTQIQYFGNTDYVSDFPLTHNLINSHFIFGSSIVHPSVILRLNEMKENKLFYDEKYKHIEDYELWTRVARIAKLANLNEVLLKYRIEGQNITVNNWDSRNDRLVNMFSKLLDELGMALNSENIQLHIEFSGNTPRLKDLKTLKKHSEQLLSLNKSKLIYDQASLKKITRQYWKRLFFKVADDNKLSKIISYWKITKSISWYQVKYILGIYKSNFFK